MAKDAPERAVHAFPGMAAPPPLRDLLTVPGALLWGAQRAAPKHAITVTIADAMGRRWTSWWDGRTHRWVKTATKVNEDTTRRVIEQLWLRWPRVRLEHGWDACTQPSHYAGQWHDAAERQARNLRDYPPPHQHDDSDGDDCA